MVSCRLNYSLRMQLISTAICLMYMYQYHISIHRCKDFVFNAKLQQLMHKGNAQISIHVHAYVFFMFCDIARYILCISMRKCDSKFILLRPRGYKTLFVLRLVYIYSILGVCARLCMALKTEVIKVFGYILRRVGFRVRTPSS